MGFRGLSYTHIAEFTQCGTWKLGLRGKAPRRYLATSEVLVPIIPILDSVVIRGLSRATVATYIVGI